MSSTFISICPALTRLSCPLTTKCPKVHYEKALTANTQESLGDCSYLNSCHRVGAGCRYLHWKLEDPEESIKAKNEIAEALKVEESSSNNSSGSSKLLNSKVEEGVVAGWADAEEVVEPVAAEPTKVDLKGKGKQVSQWMNVDLRTLDLSVLGKFDLPYGTLTDLEMLKMEIGSMQNPGGLLFLWVTGRAQDLGRECLNSWGYERIDEIVWIKTSQKQGLIRTGRTGHWLNHSKEHCLVAVRTGTPTSTPSTPSLPSSTTTTPSTTKPTIPILDTQVIISEVRETSRKPIELYGIIERMLERRSVEGKKVEKGDFKMVELFGREHNRRDGWLTLGNQFKADDFVIDKELVGRFNEKYPEKEMRVSALPVDE